MQREKFSSRLGFILISAGCAIGLGNVWRFPYITGQYGGAAFVLVYLVFMVLLGIPVMTMEFAVGRASQRSIATSFNHLEKPGQKWHLHGWVGIAGNYLLMMFYTNVAGWMLAYFVKMASGKFTGLTSEGVGEVFSSHTSTFPPQFIWMVIVIVIGILVCSLGLQKGVEKATKFMMLALLAVMVLLAIRAVTLPGAAEGLKFYLIPDFEKMVEAGVGEVIFAAMGQAFFTLSIGMGSMAIFGSYISKDRSLLGETITITALDTGVALCAGLIIFPACFAYGVDPGQGPGLVFVTLPNVFNHMPMGRLWGALFFVFMSFAALSTVIAVFENIISCFMDKFGWSRKKAVWTNFIGILVLSTPCVLGFSVWSNFAPLGPGSVLMDLEDFIVSNNILPLGSCVYVLFCVLKKGWGWDKFLLEANTGKGPKFPKWAYTYMKFVVPTIIIVIFLQGYYAKFFA